MGLEDCDGIVRIWCSDLKVSRVVVKTNWNVVEFIEKKCLYIFFLHLPHFTVPCHVDGHGVFKVQLAGPQA